MEWDRCPWRETSVNVVIEAPMPTPMAAIISTVSTRLRLRLRSGKAEVVIEHDILL